MKVAIDGTIASGKTHIGMALAEKLDVPFYSTDLIYRGYTLLFLRNGVGPNNIDDLKQVVMDNEIAVEFFNGYQRIYLNNMEVTRQLKIPLVSDNVAVFKEVEVLREIVLKQQKAFALEHDCVMAGDGATTAIMPFADYKFFLNADYAVRLERKQKNLIQEGKDVSQREILDMIYAEDTKNTQHTIAPIRISTTVKYFDTSDTTVQEATDKLFEIIKECEDKKNV